MGSIVEPTATRHEALEAFHPVIRTWFGQRFEAPTDAQTAGWPHIRAGRDTLISAPTGSGKTLAAFLAGIDGLLRAGATEPLPDETAIVYVSPLRRSQSSCLRFASPCAAATLQRRSARPCCAARRTS